MKYSHIIKIVICFLIATASTGCGKSDQNPVLVNTQNLPLSLRTPLDDCGDCPEDCCCCVIEATNQSFTISLCGLCEGDYSCGPYSPGSPCSTFSGVGKDITFTLLHTREIFCVAPGASFRIFNNSGGQISFRFTCRPDVTPSTFINVTLSNHEERFFHNDGSCIADGC